MAAKEESAAGGISTTLHATWANVPGFWIPNQSRVEYRVRMWSCCCCWLARAHYKTNTRRSIARCLLGCCWAPPRELNLKWLYFIRCGDGNGRIYVLVMIILCLVVYSFLTRWLLLLVLLLLLLLSTQRGVPTTASFSLLPPMHSLPAGTSANLCQFLNADTSIRLDRWSSLWVCSSAFRQQPPPSECTTIQPARQPAKGVAISSLCYMSTALCISQQCSGWWWLFLLLFLQITIATGRFLWLNIECILLMLFNCSSNAFLG